MRSLTIALLACVLLPFAVAGCSPSSVIDTRLPSPIVPTPEPARTAPPHPPTSEISPIGSPEANSFATASAPLGWRIFTVMTGGYTFACPENWEVKLPAAGAQRAGPLTAQLYAPAEEFPGGNEFFIFYSSYAMAPGQSLVEWNQQVFLASQDGMAPPRQILDVQQLARSEKGEQMILATELAGQDPGWHRHHLYLAHGGVILALQNESTIEESQLAAQAMRDIAATVRFLPGAPRQLAEIYDPLPRPQLAEVAATATAIAAIASSPVCDVVCRDATAWATITPGPMQTYPPEMATRERQYLESLSLATAQAMTTTPTPPPSPTLMMTPRPATQPGRVLYEGASPGGLQSEAQSFQLAYDPDAWQLASESGRDRLLHRRLTSCYLEILPGGRGMGGPVVHDRLLLANRSWRIIHWVDAGTIKYEPQWGDAALWFGLEAGRQATGAPLLACRSAAESVLNTLVIVP